MGCGCLKENSHKKKHAEDKPEIAPFDGKNRDYYEKPKPKQKTKKFQGQGVMIGTKNQNYADEYDTKEVPKQYDDDQRQKILEAAEKRMRDQESRGVKKENMFEYELQKKKLEDAKKYENEQYVLNWK